MNEEESKYLAEAQQGDMDAFAALFEPLRPLVYAVARRLVGPDEAEDMVMETYLKAWEAIPKFSGRSSLKTWLYRIAYNCSIDFIRKRGRSREVTLVEREDEHDAWANMPDDRAVGPDEEIQRTEAGEAVQSALAQLPEEHRTTLLLRFAEDMSYADIAAATGVSPGTVMSRLFYGKRRLKKILGGMDS